MTQPTDFTIADVLAWARTKPADEQYDYHNAQACAIAQFGQETGRAELINLDSFELQEKSEAVEDAVVNRPWTFGALVQRLEALCPDTPVPQSDWASFDAYMHDIETVSA
jgi:hypothetical protein